MFTPLIKKSRKSLIYSSLSVEMVIPSGLEPETCSLEVNCSIQLSYETIFLKTPL